ncbi:hypothetical protein DIPPA_00021 [Diplonema papillatum]|nr:hypothetical protein DIPPA_00021 [Diplonema papillatum]
MQGIPAVIGRTAGLRAARRWATASIKPAILSTADETHELEKAIMEKALVPQDIVKELDKYIIGQESAKRAVAISLRNRWRRTMVKDKLLRDDIHPKNILMVGPTGVGKTEVSRRMAKLTEAPFVKVEATKFTEVGFKGRDVDTIIEDLYQVAVQRAKKLAKSRNQKKARELAVNIVLSKLCADKPEEMEKYMDMLNKGELDHVEIDFTVAAEEAGNVKNAPSRGDGEGEQFKSVFIFSMDFKPTDDKGKTKKMRKTVKEALPLIESDELEKMMDSKLIARDAQHLTESHGVVFIDEIDKVVTPRANKSSDASAEGVQQDLLPLIEGSVVTLKDGVNIRTDNIMFICSGAFHVASVSDMIAELQGRLPVRVELKNLTEHDFYRILTEPIYNIIRQNVELLRTEGVSLAFTDEAIREIAKLTKQLNSEMQNIGARRLVTVVEKIVEDISFAAEDYQDKVVTIDVDYVNAKIQDMRKSASDPMKSIL